MTFYQFNFFTRIIRKSSCNNFSLTINNSHIGTGGMMTKIRAAKIVNAYGSHMVIVNGNRENSLLHSI